jgi:hypothetical protein
MTPLEQAARALLKLIAVPGNIRHLIDPSTMGTYNQRVLALEAALDAAPTQPEAIHVSAEFPPCNRPWSEHLCPDSVEMAAPTQRGGGECSCPIYTASDCPVHAPWLTATTVDPAPTQPTEKALDTTDY